MHLEGEALVGRQRAEQAQNVGDDLGQLDGRRRDLQLAHLEPRQVEDVVEDREEVLAVAPHRQHVV